MPHCDIIKNTADNYKDHSDDEIHVLAENCLTENFTDDYSGKTDYDCASAHVDIRKTLILSKSEPESATSPFESARAITFVKLMLMPCALLIAGFEPVERIVEPCSVPKYQYIAAITTAQIPSPTRIAIFILLGRNNKRIVSVADWEV